MTDADTPGAGPRAVADRFYRAFADLDHETMGASYAPGATFNDPMFDLHGEEIATMWRGLCTSAKDFRLTHRVTNATGDTAEVEWVAHYAFSRTGRPVRNEVTTTMQVIDGRIVTQVDSFSFHRWARQALGLPGLLLGWAPPFQAKVRNTAARGLGLHPNA